MAARLLQLAERHPSHLEAYIAHNSRLFLDPSVVGNLCLPALQQFAHFSRHRFGDTPSSDEAQLFEAIEHALETGEVEGLARGDSCCSSDDEAEFLDVAWRDTPLDSWAAVLRSFARTPASLPLAARLSLHELADPTLESWLDGHLPATLAALTPTDEAQSVAPLTGKAVHAARECSERIEKLVLEGSSRALCVSQTCEARLGPMQERDMNSLARAAEAVNTDVETATHPPTLEDCIENPVEGVVKAIAAREGDRELLPSTEERAHAAWCAELCQVLGRAALLAHFLCEPILEDSMHVVEAKEEVARSALLACKTLLAAEEKLGSEVYQRGPDLYHFVASHTQRAATSAGSAPMRVIVLSLLILASSIATTASPPHHEAQPDDPPPQHVAQPDDPPQHEAQPDDPPQHEAQPDDPPQQEAQPDDPPQHEAQPDDPPPMHEAQPDDPPPMHEAQHDASPGGDAAPPREVLTAQPATTGGAADARVSPSTPSESAADAPPTKKRLPLKLALRAARPWSFSATATPVALGTALAFQVEDKFRLVRLVLTLMTTLSVHAAGNLMNTYFDFVHGVDKPGATSDTTLVNGELQPSQETAHLVLWSYGIAAAAAAPLCAVSKAPLRLLLAHLAAGAASAFVYTGGPGLKYKALGDLLISATFGPLLVSFAYLVQAGKTSWRTVLASLPLTAHIEAILHANNARDVEEDLANGVATLAAALGRRLSSALYALLMAAPFAAALAHAWWRSLVSALPLLSAPVGMSLVQDFYRQRMKDLPKRTAKFQLLFGVLLVTSVLIPSPSIQALLRRAL
ncbi:hypothetical protein AB1Y20_002382 [Prymnesium parvum]|uniref:UbiA prenyltransferase domain-containing protein 1 n=1 Tax=Prymnesium parvum TaxID=97485 RepID=A0AB34JAR3_PRYPA